MNIWLPLLQTAARALQSDIAADQGLDLKTGEVVYGTLLEMADAHTALMELKGRSVRAHTEIQMPIGTRIPLLVVGTRDNGQLELKVLNDEIEHLLATGGSHQSPDVTLIETSASRNANNSQPNNSQPNTSQPLIERVLRNLGIVPSPLRIAIAHSLLDAKVSVQPTLLQAMETIVQQEQNNYRTSIQMQQQGTQPEPAELQTISTKAVQMLTSMVQKKIPVMPETYEAMKALWSGPSLQQLLSEPDVPSALRSELLGNFSLELSQLDNVPTAERGALLASAAVRMGYDHEARLLLSMLAQPQQTDTTIDTLKSLLLQEQLHNPSSKPLEQALYQVTGQQLMHSARDEQSPFLYQFIAVPMSVDNQAANANIHVLTRKKGNRQLDPNNCYLYFQLSMPSLGDIGIHVQVLERLVTVRLVAEQETVLNLQEKELAILQSGLAQAGYQLGSVRKETGSADNIAPFSQLPIVLTGAGMDFKI